MAGGNDGLRPNTGAVPGAQPEEHVIREVVAFREIGNLVEEILAQFVDSGPEVAVQVAVDIDGRQVVTEVLVAEPFTANRGGRPLEKQAMTRGGTRRTPATNVRSPKAELAWMKVRPGRRSNESPPAERRRASVENSATPFQNPVVQGRAGCAPRRKCRCGTPAGWPNSRVSGWNRTSREPGREVAAKRHSRKLGGIGGASWTTRLSGACKAEIGLSKYHRPEPRKKRRSGAASNRHPRPRPRSRRRERNRNNSR